MVNFFCVFVSYINCENEEEEEKREKKREKTTTRTRKTAVLPFPSLFLITGPCPQKTCCHP